MLSMFKKKETVVKNLNDQTFEVGNWLVQFNAPYGLVVRNTQDVKAEYHFLHDSVGWFTSLVTRKKLKSTAVHNETGRIQGQPMLVDKESAVKYARFIELQKKGNSLSEDEMKELLTLMGVMGD